MVHSLSHFVKKTLAILVGSALLCLSTRTGASRLHVSGAERSRARQCHGKG